MNQTKELRKFVAPEIITGVDARLMIGRYILHFASKKPMIVTDKNVRSLPWFQDIIVNIEKTTDKYVVYDNVSANPKDGEVIHGTEMFLAHKCDMLIAVGGGSSIDLAKGIRVISSNGGEILDYEGVDEVEYPGPPLICIPSTAGSSADVSQFSVIYDSVNHLKKTIISKKIVPDLALLDPIPLMTMDFYLTACTGMDALTHAMESYVSNASSPLTDLYAERAIQLINEHMVESVSPERTVDVMYQMMLGSLYAGLAFSNASLGAVHAMAHSLGGLLDIPHGKCNSVLLEHIIGVNFMYATKRYIRIAELMGLSCDNKSAEEVKILLIQRVKTLREKCGIRPYIKIFKVTEELLGKLQEAAFSDPCLVTNPKILTKDEVNEIYGRILCEKGKEEL